MSTGVIKEFLVSLGLQDDLSENLKESLQDSSDSVSGFVGNWGEQWFLAGGAVVSALVVANVGVAKFLQKLVVADDELNEFAEQTGLAHDEAWKAKSALDAMGKSMEEIQADPDLYREFEDLRESAEKLKPPDMSEGLDQVRGIISEVTKLKQIGGAAIQWIGHYLLKYIEKPLQQVKDGLGSINEKITKNLPSWSEKIGMALSWIVRLGVTLIRGAGQVLNAIKRVFDMIPGNVKIAIAAFAALAMFIRAGPIGKLITILSLALLLLEDFFTYLDGGDALLAPVWKTLAGLFNGFIGGCKDALNFFSEDFLPGLFDLIGSVFPKLVDKAMEFVDPLLDFAVQVLEGLIKVLSDNLPGLIKLLADMGIHLLSALLAKIPAVLDAGAELLNALIDGITGMLPNLIGALVGILRSLLSTITKHLPIIVDAGISLIMSLIDGILQALPDILDAIMLLVDDLLQLLVDTLPQLIEAGIKIVISLVDGIAKALPKIIKAALTLIQKLLSSLLERLPEIIQAGVKMLMSLVKGIMDALPQLIKTAVEMIPVIVQTLVSALPQLIETGIEMLISLVTGIIDALPQLIQIFIEMIPTIMQTLIDSQPQLIEAGIILLLALIEGIIGAIPQLIAAIPQIIGAILGGLASLGGSLLDVGKSVVKSLWNGICSMGSWLKDKVTGFFSGIWNGVKGAFSSDDPDPVPKPTGGGGGTGGGASGMPGHADGGIFGQEHVARFAEDNKPEAVIPLSKPTRAKEVLGQAIKYLGPEQSQPGATGMSSAVQSLIEKAGAMFDKIDMVLEKIAGKLTACTVETATAPSTPGTASAPPADDKAIGILEKLGSAISDKLGAVETKSQAGTSGGLDLEFFASAKSFMERVSEVLAKMNQTMTGGAAVAAVTNTSANTTNNNQSYDMKSTFNVYDSSGNPQSTATAVDRQQQLRIRNMQGVIA